MSLPTIIKTWQLAHTTIATQGSALLNMQHTMRVGIKNALLGLSTNPPTVKGSSDGTTGAMDNTDRWSADAKLVWAATGTNHSWIVLQFQSGWQLLLDLNNASTGTITAFVSPAAGFTGGSVTTAPTATDQWASPFGGAWVNTNTDTQRIVHIWMPTDGTAFRGLLYKAGVLEAFWQFETVASATPGWVTPMVGYWTTYAALAKPLYSDLSTSTFVYQTKFPNGSFFGGCTLTTEGSCTSGAVGQLQTTANGIDGTWPFSAIGLYTNFTSNAGFQGRLTDCWFGSTTRNTGDLYPATGSAQFLHFGNLIWPWDGTVALVTS